MVRLLRQLRDQGAEKERIVRNRCVLAPYRARPSFRRGEATSESIPAEPSIPVRSVTRRMTLRTGWTFRPAAFEREAHAELSRGAVLIAPPELVANSLEETTK
jgi:hypothetical protein